MSEYMIVPKDSIDDTADAIKTKLGTQNDLVWGQDGFASYVEDIPSGGALARLTDHVEITPTTTLTMASRLNVNLTVGNNCAILVMPDVMPSPPDTGYTALCWAQCYSTNGTVTAFGTIVRANGTIGTDVAECAYDTSTGVLQIGGQYGYYPAGAKYHVYRFEMG